MQKQKQQLFTAHSADNANVFGCKYFCNYFGSSVLSTAKNVLQKMPTCTGTEMDNEN